jgi:hypothetical protein
VVVLGQRQRFVVVQTVGGGMVTPITVVKGWAAEFKNKGMAEAGRE